MLSESYDVDGQSNMGESPYSEDIPHCYYHRKPGDHPGEIRRVGRSGVTYEDISEVRDNHPYSFVGKWLGCFLLEVPWLVKLP